MAILAPILNKVDVDYLVNYLNNKYGEFSYFVPSRFANEFLDNGTELFIAEFNRYASTQTLNTARLLLAFNSDYNPIENYDLKSDVLSAGDTAKIETSVGGYTNTHYDATFDGTTKETAKDNVASRTDSTEVKDRLNVKFDGDSSSTSWANKNRTQERKHGNIGTMSVPDQIKKELDVRLMNIVNTIIDNIALELLVYVGDE